MEDGIESTSIVDSLWQPNDSIPVLTNRNVFLQPRIFRRSTLFIVGRRREYENERYGGAGNMLG